MAEQLIERRLVRAGAARSSPAGSTHRCGRFVPSAVCRTSSHGARVPTSGTSKGRRYLDYVQSYGASILGHAHPDVVKAVVAAAAAGHDLRGADRGRGPPGRGHLRAGGGLRDGPAGLQRHRGDHVGGAGGAGRDRQGPHRRLRGLLPRPLRRAAGRWGQRGGDARAAGQSAGVPKAAVAETLVVPYNVVPEIGDDVAARHRRAGGRQHGPGPARRPGSSRACGRPVTAAGALLIFDEVITGFRLGPGGASGLFGVRPDLWCFGKVIGGGLPVGAFGGRRDVMSLLAPARPGVPGGDVVGEPAGHRGRSGGAGPARRRGLPGAGRRGRPASPPGCRRRWRAPAWRCRCRSSGPWSGCFSPTPPVHDFAGAKASADDRALSAR